MKHAFFDGNVWQYPSRPQELTKHAEVVVFESMRTGLQRRVRFLSDHLERLVRSMMKLGLAFHAEVDRKDLFVQIQKVVGLNKDQSSGPLKIKVQGAPPFWSIIAEPLEIWPPESYEKGIVVQDALFAREASSAKYESPVYAAYAQLASDHGRDEIIFVDDKGYIREGNVSNIFLVIDGVLLTPKEGVLLGIMRKKVLKEAQKKGIPTKQRRILLTEKEKASEIFITNSLKGIVPVREWGDWRGKKGAVVKALEHLNI